MLGLNILHCMLRKLTTFNVFVMIIVSSMTVTALYTCISQILYLYTIFNMIVSIYTLNMLLIVCMLDQNQQIAMYFSNLHCNNLHIIAALLTNAKIHGESSKGKMINFKIEDMNITRCN